MGSISPWFWWLLPKTMAAHGAHSLPPPPGETRVGGTAPSPAPLSKGRVAGGFCSGFMVEAQVPVEPGGCLPQLFITGMAGNKIQQMFV